MECYKSTGKSKIKLRVRRLNSELFMSKKLSFRIICFIVLIIALFASAFGQKAREIEIVDFEKDSGTIQVQEAFLIEDTELEKTAESIGCEGLKTKYIKVTYHNFFNDQPFNFVRYIAAKCISETDYAPLDKKNVRDSDNQKLEITHTTAKYLGSIIKVEERYNNAKRRSLAGYTAAAQSTVTGTGVSSFLVNTSVTITVTAKDSTSTNVGVGDDIFFVEITNACVKGGNYECVAVSGRDTVLTSDIVQQMFDKLDGSYYYTYTVSNPGKITISPLLYTLGGVYSEFYPNNAWTNTNTMTTTNATIDINWTTGAIFSTCTDNCSAKYYFRFQAPTTGTITFTLNSDDTSKLYIEGTLVITAAGTSVTGTYTCIKNQYYRGYVTYVEYTSSAYIYLYWTYGSVGTIIIPTTSLYYPAYVGSSPIQVTVTCPTYLPATIISGTPTCATKCGDGYRYGTEACDDGNTVSGDGCSSTCTNEQNYVCSGGSSISKDTCFKCSYDYTNNASYSSCQLKSISYYAKWLAISTWIVVVFGLIFEIANSIVTRTSPMGAYFILEHIQILAIIPAIGMYFTDDLYGYFRIMSHSLLGYDFISIESVFVRSYTYAQDNTFLDFLGFNSSSSFVNCLNYFLGLAVIAALQLICFRIFGMLEENNAKKTTFLNVLSILSDWFFLGAYIRYLLLGAVLVLVSSIDEVSSNSKSGDKWSFVLAISFLVVYGILWICCLIYCIIVMINKDFANSSYLMELVNGLKPNIFARFYTNIFMLHRIALIILFVPSIGISLSNILISAISIQGAYFVGLCVIRPFAILKHNIIKIFLEMVTFILFVLLYMYRNGDWTSARESAFIALMMLSSMLPFVVSIPSFFYNLSIRLLSPEDFVNGKRKPANQNNIFEEKKPSSMSILNLKKPSIIEEEKIPETRIINMEDVMKVNKEKKVNMINSDRTEIERIKQSRQFQIDPSLFPGIISNLKTAKKNEVPRFIGDSNLFGQ